MARQRHDGRSMVLAVAALFMALALRHVEGAASYLGCFEIEKFLASIKSHKASWKVADCESRCKQASYPLFGLAAQDTLCVCGTYIPNGLHQLTDDNCIAKTVPSLALYYSHYTKDAGCRLAPLPITDDFDVSDYWTAAEGTEDKMVFLPEQDTIVMQLIGTYGPRLFSNDMSQYGLFSAKMMVTEVNGCVSAFYLTSSTDNTNIEHDEIDFEFVNGQKGNPTDTPGSVWLNYWVDGKSIRTMLQKPAAIQTKVQQPAFQTYEGFHTYVIDWQPGYIRWYIDGRRVWERSEASSPVMPELPQAFTVSLWTKTQERGWRTQKSTWGGILEDGPNHPPYESIVANSRRVLCDLPNPVTMSMGAERIPATFEVATQQAAPLTEGKPVSLPPGTRFYPPPPVQSPPPTPLLPARPPPPSPSPPAPSVAAEGAGEKQLEASTSSSEGSGDSTNRGGGSSSTTTTITSKPVIVGAARADGDVVASSSSGGVLDTSGDTIKITGSVEQGTQANGASSRASRSSSLAVLAAVGCGLLALLAA